jgi:hypothetical protein
VGFALDSRWICVGFALECVAIAHRALVLKHLAGVFPRHIQIHYGQYRREQLFEAARRSRACAYLADDDHGPLALQEILLAGCPTVGVRTGAAFVRDGVNGYLIDRLPPGRRCVEKQADADGLSRYLDALYRAQALDRREVRGQMVHEFTSSRIGGLVLEALEATRTAVGRPWSSI